MPAQQNDVAFGFDPRPFMNGLGKVEKGLGNLTKTVTGVAGQMTRKIIGLGIAFAGIKAVVGHLKAAMPEVGMALKIAGEVFWKNFAWPLRKLVVPMLQQLLNWVRDNRTRFVQWGQAVANVFKVVVFVVGKFVSYMREIIHQLGPAFKRIFGNNFSDFLNVLALKAAFIMELVGMVSMELAKGLGQLVDRLTNAGLMDLVKALGDLLGHLISIGVQFGKGMWEGFLLAIDALLPSITQLVEMLGSIFGALDEIGGKTGIWEKMGKAMVQGFGAAILLILQSVMLIIEGIRFMVEVIGGASKVIGAGFSKGSRADFNKMWAEGGARQTEMFKKFGEQWQSLFPQEKPPDYSNTGVLPSYVTPVNDAMITKKGEVVKFNPNDTIFATKGGGMGVSTVNVNLTVTEGNARSAGEQFGLGFAERFRREVLSGATAGGM